MKYQIIPAYLVKDFLCDGYGGALVFHNDLGRAGFVIDDTVATTAHTIEFYSLLIGYM